MPSVELNTKESVASRKQTALELRKARKEGRQPRNRLLSDSSDEAPKGILKHPKIPTKRSVSECVDDLSQIMADLDLNIHDLPKVSRKFCPHHQEFYLNEEDEEGDCEDNEDHDDDDEDEDGDDEEEDDYEDDEDEPGEENNNKQDENSENNNGKDIKSRNGNLKLCDCNIKYGDSNDKNQKPKKSVRFDERVHEAFFVVSRLYDRRNIAKYHFSSRHHPPTNQNVNKSKKGRQHSSKSESKDDFSASISNLKSDNSYGLKMSKSQRAKQSKKDKKKRSSRKEETTDTSSDDQGYCSAFHSFSD